MPNVDAERTDCLARPDRYEPATMRCVACRLAWDTSDKDRPECPLVVTLGVERGADAPKQIGADRQLSS